MFYWLCPFGKHHQKQQWTNLHPVGLLFTQLITGCTAPYTARWMNNRRVLLWPRNDNDDAIDRPAFGISCNESHLLLLMLLLSLCIMNNHNNTASLCSYCCFYGVSSFTLHPVCDELFQLFMFLCHSVAFPFISAFNCSSVVQIKSPNIYLWKSLSRRQFKWKTIDLIELFSEDF